MPRKLTDALEKRLVARIRNGVAITVAVPADESGISLRSVMNWLAVGRGVASPALERKFPDAKTVKRCEKFAQRIDQAYALFEIDCVEDLQDPPEDWFDDRGRLDRTRCANIRWLLERTRRERYGLKLTIEAMREEASEHLINALRERLDPTTFAIVVGALTGEGGDEGDGESVDADSFVVH